MCINSCCSRHEVLQTVGRRSRAGLVGYKTGLLSQLAVGSEECGAPCRGGKEGEAGEGHVELITYLQLLVGHGGQSRHVEGEVAGGAHVHLGVRCLVVGLHEQTLRDERRRQEREREGGRRPRPPGIQQKSRISVHQ